jgi:hypothetical protein
MARDCAVIYQNKTSKSMRMISIHETSSSWVLNAKYGLKFSMPRISSTFES